MSKKEEIKLTEQEKQAIEARRKEEEITKKCAEEVNEVLRKYGRTLQVAGQPQIIIVPINK